MVFQRAIRQILSTFSQRGQKSEFRDGFNFLMTKPSASLNLHTNVARAM
jgi:hypothetical protein